MIVRPLLVTGIALASTGALVAGTPTVVTPQQAPVAAASAPVKRTLSVDQLKLLAWADIVSAWEGGYGPFVGGNGDDYYPNHEPAAQSGFTGVAFYLTDEALYAVSQANVPVVSDAAWFAYSKVSSYFFEIGATAALHVALAEATGGPETPFAQLLQQIFNPDGVQAVGTFAAASLALPDLTGIVDAWDGNYGPWVGGKGDDYYPNHEPKAASGFTGVAFYLTDEALYAISEADIPVVSDAAWFAYDKVSSYFFEIGAPAALHVALAEATGGPSTPFAQVLQQIFNPDAVQAVSSNANLAEDFSIQSRGSAEALDAGGNAPTDLPKTGTKLVNLSESEGQEPEEPGTEASDPEEPGTEADSNADEPEQPVKKKPQLNVKKVNPLADLGEQLNDVKRNVDKTLKAVGDGVSQLVGGGSKVTTPDEPAGSKVEPKVDNEPKDTSDDQSAKKDAA